MAETGPRLLGLTQQPFAPVLTVETFERDQQTLLHSFQLKRQNSGDYVDELLALLFQYASYKLFNCECHYSSS